MTMNYKITISELNYNDGILTVAAPVYEQTVENLNIRAVIEAVNADAPFEILPIRKRAPRSDKGKKRNVEPVAQ